MAISRNILKDQMCLDHGGLASKTKCIACEAINRVFAKDLAEARMECIDMKPELRQPSREHSSKLDKVQQQIPLSGEPELIQRVQILETKLTLAQAEIKSLTRSLRDFLECTNKLAQCIENITKVSNQQRYEQEATQNSVASLSATVSNVIKRRR